MSSILLLHQDKEYFLCSDAAAIIQYTANVIFLADNQVVTLKVGGDVVSTGCWLQHRALTYIHTCKRNNTND